MIDRFNELLNELGVDLDILLIPEDNGSCSLKIDDDLVIQLEVEKDKENILMGSFICELPPGKFRENVFINALKANGQIPNSFTFAFNSASAELALFTFQSQNDLNLKSFKEKLEMFIELAMEWKEAIDNGNAAPANFLRDIEQSKSSIFSPNK